MCKIVCFPPVHSQPKQQQLAVLPGGQDALVKAEAKEAVPDRGGKQELKCDI